MREVTAATPFPAARLTAHQVGSDAALPAESCSLREAGGRVLAEDLTALAGLPGFPTSVMDGWAVAGPGPWRLAGQSLAGMPFAGPLQVGHAVVIATGAPVPRGADAVIRSEIGQVHAGMLHAVDPASGTYIRPPGEECQAGETLAVAGSVVTPALIGLAAAVGWDNLSVVRQPRVKVLLFGDELVDSGVAPYGRVRDALGPAMPAWLGAMGATVTAVTCAQDTLAAHVAALASAVASADLVLTTGGTARGPVDHIHAALREVGAELVIDRVAVRPGHPMLLAVAGDGSRVPIVGLPGNPQSAVIALVVLADPVIRGMSGRALPPLGATNCANALHAPADEHRLVAGTRGPKGFDPAAHLGSAMLRGLVSAQGFAVVPPGGSEPGDELGWLALPGAHRG